MRCVLGLVANGRRCGDKFVETELAMAIPVCVCAAMHVWQALQKKRNEVCSRLE